MRLIKWGDLSRTPEVSRVRIGSKWIFFPKCQCQSCCQQKPFPLSRHVLSAAQIGPKPMESVKLPALMTSARLGGSRVGTKDSLPQAGLSSGTL